MIRSTVFALAPLLAAGILHAQTPAPMMDLGLKVQPVPSVLADHLPKLLEAGRGLLVAEVRPGSRAAQIGLRRHDVILSVGAAPVATAQPLLDRLISLKDGEREVLEVIRGGKKLALSWPNVAQFSATANAYIPPRSVTKPNGPPAVSVQVQPMTGDELSVTILYYGRATGKMVSHSFRGPVASIERQVREAADDRRIPADVYDLIGVALSRLRSRTAPSTPR